MELKDVRVGIYVKEFKYSSRGRALEPFYRVKYNDLGYYNFMQPILIDKEWCKRLKMAIEERIHPSGNYDWIAEAPGIRIKADKGEITVFHNISGCSIILEHIKYVHQIQNFYYGFWGMEIDDEHIKNREFYSKSLNK
jgi:hypothetical protein